MNFTQPNWTNMNIMEDFTYNLTKVFSSDIIERPDVWIGTMNNLLNGWIMVSFLVVLAIVLFLMSKRIDDVSDSQAAMYSGIVTSILGILLFFIEPVEGMKLISFIQLVPFFTVTLLAVAYNRFVKRY